MTGHLIWTQFLIYSPFSLLSDPECERAALWLSTHCALAQRHHATTIEDAAVHELVRQKPKHQGCLRRLLEPV